MTPPDSPDLVTIRAATPDDAPALTTIAHAAKAHWSYPVAWLEAWDGALTLTPEYVVNHDVFAAEVNGRIVGVCALARLEEAWSLDHVWVDPDAHGRGIGRFLVLHAVNIARTAEPRLPVRVQSDPQAAGFYAALGARSVGEVKAPMPDAPDRTLPVFEF